MHTFTVWKTDTCSFCNQAKGFLSALQEARDDVEVRFKDANMDRAGFRAVATRVGKSTVPQIFLDTQYIGGWSELATAAGNGKLDSFLNGTEWTPKPSLFARLFGKK